MTCCLCESPWKEASFKEHAFVVQLYTGKQTSIPRCRIMDNYDTRETIQD